MRETENPDCENDVLHSEQNSGRDAQKMWQIFDMLPRFLFFAIMTAITQGKILFCLIPFMVAAVIKDLSAAPLPTLYLSPEASRRLRILEVIIWSLSAGVSLYIFISSFEIYTRAAALGNQREINSLFFFLWLPLLLFFLARTRFTIKGSSPQDIAL